MSYHDYLSADGQAVLLLCSAFALAGTGDGGELEPLKLREWNELERSLRGSTLQHPAALQGCAADELERTLRLPAGEATRIARLLELAGPLSQALERLFEAGLWAVTRVDELYPWSMRERLRDRAPAVLFGAGDIQLVKRAGIAVVGSRNIDEAGAAFAKTVGTRAVAAGLPVVSGGARGTDRLAMQAALEAGGVAIGALADSLIRTARQPDVREFIDEGRLVLLTQYAPDAGFSVGAAMGRNKLIYGQAECAFVVSSDLETGGTWAGAVEALKAGWCPVVVRNDEGAPTGNRGLLERGAVPMTSVELTGITDLRDWTKAHAARPTKQPDLFGFPDQPSES